MAQGRYLRDGRAPIPKDERTSALMSRIRSVDTTPELAVRSELRLQGFTGYRLHYAKVPGRPDIAFVGLRVAVFVHGCFWHGCPYCKARRPRTNKGFWNAKLDRNKERDAEKERALRRAGWSVMTLWECRIRRSPEAAVAGVVRKVASARKALRRSASRTPKRT